MSKVRINRSERIIYRGEIDNIPEYLLSELANETCDGLYPKEQVMCVEMRLLSVCILADTVTDIVFYILVTYHLVIV